MDQNHALLFSDWELDDIIKTFHTDREDDLSGLVGLIQHGKTDEAAEWLRIETSRYPYMLLIYAHLNLQKGNPDQAAKQLRAVTLLSQETLVQLWAWHNLMKLGKSPAQAMAQQVMGIIIEVPYENSVEVLASYADGTARYINHAGGMILWEDYDQDITPLIYEGLKLAHPIGKATSRRAENPIAEGDVRLTLLCPGNIYTWEGSPEDGSDIARLFAQQANLLRTLVRVALKKREDEN